MCECAVTAPPTLVNLVIIGSVATHKILAQLVNRILRYGDRGARPHVQRWPTPPMTCRNHVPTSSPPTHTTNLNTIGQAVPEIQKRGVHVRKCRDTPNMTYVRHLVHDPQRTHQNWTQSAEPFLRYKSAACTCARAEMPNPWLVEST